MQAAVAAAMAPAEPDVIMPDSAPESAARRLPTAACSSNISTNCREAASIASRTSGITREPLRYVQVPRALINGRIPSLSYTFAPVPVAADNFRDMSCQANAPHTGVDAAHFMNKRRCCDLFAIFLFPERKQCKLSLSSNVV